MIMEMARISIEDGLVMQIHPGSMRNHNERIFNKFGLDQSTISQYRQSIHKICMNY